MAPADQEMEIGGGNVDAPMLDLFAILGVAGGHDPGARQHLGEDAGAVGGEVDRYEDGSGQGGQLADQLGKGLYSPGGGANDYDIMAWHLFLLVGRSVAGSREAEYPIVVSRCVL